MIENCFGLERHVKYHMEVANNRSCASSTLLGEGTFPGEIGRSQNAQNVILF